MSVFPSISKVFPLLAWSLTGLLVLGCTSAPRHGAARKKKKGCDCPKWNRTESRQDGRHAFTWPKHEGWTGVEGMLKPMAA
ncbi:MAG: hypothetical protein JNM31_11590 [Flavobacteriales bacterium]|nr:hypothetical protein [Flavobacteriales bacterium]